MRLLAALNAVFLLAAFGCGDDGGGCGPAPEKKEETPAAGGGSGNHGSTSSGGDIIIQEKKSNKVPQPYQRPASSNEPEKSTATIKAPVVAVSSKTAVAAKLPTLGVARVTKRKVDGVADRVEVACRVMAASSDGLCSSAANYDEIKERCCPGGLVERCKTTMTGVLLVGRGCELPKAK